MGYNGDQVPEIWMQTFMIGIL